MDEHLEQKRELSSFSETKATRPELEEQMKAVRFEFQDASKTVQEVVPLLQTGANCGCFAAAMAIASLLNVDKSKSELIARDIQEVSEIFGISSIGELFDADALAAAINTYCVYTTDKEKWSEKLLAKSVVFSSEDELVDILTVAKSRGVRVLIPYYAGNEDDCDPAVPIPEDRIAGKVSPQKMYCAHWATAAMGEAVGEKMIVLKEGNKKTNREQYPAKALFNSNNSLGDTFSWNDFLTESDTSEQAALLGRIGIGKDYTRLRSLMSRPFISDGLPKEAPEEKIVEKARKDGIERVNLRGKLILVGREKMPPKED